MTGHVVVLRFELRCANANALAACQQEYPNESGAGNPYSASDAANLLSFFQSLRTALGSSKIISAAVTQLPWTGSNGSPLTNVSAYASVMTYANIMSVPHTPLPAPPHSC